MDKSFSIKSYDTTEEIVCYLFYKENKIGCFYLDYTMKENYIYLGEFEIYEPFQGNGYSKILAYFVKKELSFKFKYMTMEIEIYPYGNQRLSEKELKKLYKKLFNIKEEEENFLYV